MKRTKLDKGKLRLSTETVRLLDRDHLRMVNGGHCTAGMTSTYNDGLCTEACQDSYRCDSDVRC